MNTKSFSCFADEGNWYKGNLHSHTTRSDGAATPEAVVDWYARHGYDFLAITDHDVIVETEDLQRDELLVLPGIEFAYRPDEDPEFFLDMLGINLKTLPEFLDPDGTGKVHYPKNLSPQAIIDAVNDAGALAIMCHPYYYRNMTEPYLRYHSYLGIEAYNYVCDETCGRGYHEVYWDAALLRGRKLMGFATDDSHAPDFGHAWVEVKAKEKTVPAILEAIRSGSYYSTTGIRIYDVAQHGDKMRITFDRPCDVVFVTVGWRGMVRSYHNGFELVDGEKRFYAEYNFTGKEAFMRIELIDSTGKKAYTNPIYPASEE